MKPSQVYMRYFFAVFLSFFLVTCSISPESELSNNRHEPTARCQQKPDSGQCRAAFQRFYFDQTTQQCQVFLWGGCKGSVPFDSLSECQKICE